MLLWINIINIIMQKHLQISCVCYLLLFAIVWYFLCNSWRHSQQNSLFYLYCFALLIILINNNIIIINFLSHIFYFRLGSYRNKNTTDVAPKLWWFVDMHWIFLLYCLLMLVFLQYMHLVCFIKNNYKTHIAWHNYLYNTIHV